MTHLVPSFTYRPVRNTDGDAIRPIGLVLHVQAGNGSPYGWFNNPASQVSSNLWAGKAGQREQYVPSDVRAWAQSAGNKTYDSIETEGFPNEPLTTQQIETVAQAYADGVRTFGWAVRVTDTVGQSGLILHGDGGAAWGGHTGCPGHIRADQRGVIIIRVNQILNGTEDDMPSVEEVATAVSDKLTADYQTRARALGFKPESSFGAAIAVVEDKVGLLQAAVTKVTGDVDTDATIDGVQSNTTLPGIVTQLETLQTSVDALTEAPPTT